MRKLINLTQHTLTETQKEGFKVIELDTTLVKELLTFTELPSITEINIKALSLANLVEEALQGLEVEEAPYVLIGGAPYLMSTLERKLRYKKVQPVYSFSERKSVEVEKDGVVTKTNVFEHVGYIEV